MSVIGVVWRVGARGAIPLSINVFLILFWYLNYVNKLSITFEINLRSRLYMLVISVLGRQRQED